MKPAADRILNNLLIAGCLIVWLWSGWQPHERSTWIMEQVASGLALATLLWLQRRTHFSSASHVCIAAMFCIHTIGTHYTYSLTPYNELSESLLGSSVNDWFGWQRNHYDRFVHFAYGLLLLLPTMEALRSRLGLGLSVAGFLSLQLIIASSALYELLEWGAAVIFGGDMGTAYLGTQGDPWDAQADIALASLGGLLVLVALLMLLRNRTSARIRVRITPQHPTR